MGLGDSEEYRRFFRYDVGSEKRMQKMNLMAEQKTENGPSSLPDADESLYRPYSYKEKVQNNPNGTGILFTEWSTDHQFNYFRYWIGQNELFSHNAKEISNALKTVIMRKKYALSDVKNDLMIENGCRRNDLAAP